MNEKVTMTIEDEVVFMLDPHIEFVSLVAHAANQTPFKVLKSQKGVKPDDGEAVHLVYVKKEDEMEKEKSGKVLQAILVPISCDIASLSELTKDCRLDEVLTYDTYKAYVQMDRADLIPESIEVVVLDEALMVMGVVGSLKVEKPDKDSKSLVGDGATVEAVSMDEVYQQLYAMADIVSGALRQVSGTASYKLDTILTAIDNFKTFASMVLGAVPGEKELKEIDPEHFPDLAFPLIRKKEDKTEDTDVDLKELDEKVTALAAQMTVSLDEIRQAVDAMKTSVAEGVKTEILAVIDGKLEPLQAGITEMKTTAQGLETSLSEVKSRVNPIEGYITGLKSTLKSQRTMKSEGLEKSGDEGGVFSGVFLNAKKSTEEA